MLDTNKTEDKIANGVSIYALINENLAGIAGNSNHAIKNSQESFEWAFSELNFRSMHAWLPKAAAVLMQLAHVPSTM